MNRSPTSWASARRRHLLRRRQGRGSGQARRLARTRVAEQLDLLEKGAFRFCWIVDFPMYEFNDEQQKDRLQPQSLLDAAGRDGGLETKDPLEILAWQYDIVCNGVELSSARSATPPGHHVQGVRDCRLHARGVDTNFSGMINAFKYGAPPHGGSAPGIDRHRHAARRRAQHPRSDPLPDEPEGED
jgi:aspartyl-tRNA synthetase